MKKNMRWFKALLLLLPAAASAADVRLLETTDSHLIAEVRFDSLRVRREMRNGRPIDVVVMPGAGVTAEPGRPLLPMIGLWFGVPPESEPRMTVIGENSRLCSVAALEYADKEGETIDGPYPAAAAEITASGFLRDRRVVCVSLYPARCTSPNTLQLAQSLRFRIDFNAGSIALSATSAEDPFDALFSARLVNEAQSRGWRRAATPARLFKSVLQPSTVRLYLNEDGVYAVSGLELAEAGVDLSAVDPRTLALSCGGRPVPLIVEGFADGRFDYQDRILFIGEHLRGDNSFLSPFSDNAVYQLSWNGGPGLRFAPLNVEPTGDWAKSSDAARFTAHLEKDVLYDRLVSFNDEKADHWFWARLSNAETFSLPVELPGAVSERPFTFRCAFHGLTVSKTTNVNHHILVSLNDRPIGEVYGSGISPFVMSASGSMPAEKTLRLTFRLPLDIPGVTDDHVFLNWFEFTYDRRLTAQNGFLSFDASGSGGDLRLNGFVQEDVLLLTADGRRLNGYAVRRADDGFELLMSSKGLSPTRVYAVDGRGLRKVARIEADEPSDLRNPENRADYIIITHRDFMRSAERLAAYRESRGLKTMVVDVQDIFDEFSGSVFDPHAIRSFLKTAYETWRRPAPAYVLLFGDTTYLMDKDAAAASSFKSFVPSFMVYTVSFGMTSSDNYFAAVSGDDDLPDLFIGRLPANNESEAEAMIDKIIAYETREPFAEWRRNVTLASGSGDFFGQAAQYTADNCLPRWLALRRLSTDYTSPYFHTSEELIDWINQGQNILNFLVHGAGEMIDDAKLLEKDDLLRLRNADKYPFCVTMSCYIGHFDNPERQSLGEAMLTAPNKGIMALFGSAGKSYRYADFYFNNAVFDGIFRHGRRTLGEITTLAKYDLMSQTRGFVEPVRNFLLLGDPALALRLPNESLELRLSKTVLAEGDRLRVSGRTPGAGVLTLTASTKDTVLAEQRVDVSGSFDVELLTMTPQLRRRWGPAGGEGFVTAVFRSGESAAAGAKGFSVVRPLVKRCAPLPEQPVGFQPFAFIAEIDSAAAAESGLQELVLQWTTGADWNDAPMNRFSTNLWRTADSFSLEEGTAVSFRLKMRNASGTIVGEAQQLTVLYRPDLYSNVPLRWVSNGGDRMLITVKNRGGSDARNVPLSVVDRSNNRLLVDRLVVPRVRSRADTTIAVPAAPAAGSFDYELVIDPDDVVPEEEESNNRLTGTARRVTPTQGSAGVLRFFDDEATVSIPANCLPRGTSVELIASDNKATSSSARLVPLKTPNAPARSFSLRFADSTLTAETPIRITVAYDPQDSLTAACIAAQSARLYAYHPDFRLWKALTSTHVAAGCRFAADLPAGLTTFALMASDDRTAPQIRIDAEGQHLADGDRMPPRPTLLVTLEDDAAVDISPDALRLTLDGVPLRENGYAMTFSADNPRRAHLTLSTDFTEGDHELVVSAADIHGNVVSRSLRFSIAETFGLRFVANHPNPFVDRTTIAFYIDAMAAKVKLDIFTVSGRRLRAWELVDITGYHEIDWDGTDDDGRPVANGVYYLKMVAVNDQKRIERIEKMAKLE